MRTETDTTYNGWANYATWRVNLELCDEYISSRLNDITDEIERGISTPEEFSDLSTWVEELREYVDDVLTNYGEITDGITLDYAQSFVSEVDFYEIAQHAVDELTERLEYEAQRSA